MSELDALNRTRRAHGLPAVDMRLVFAAGVTWPLWLWSRRLRRRLEERFWDS